MAEGAGSREQFLPAQYQPALPLDRLILKDGSPGAGDRMELDVLIVGAGPAGLACAIELAQLAKGASTELSIGVLEKAAALGEHSLSGAVVNPRAFRELFPDMQDSDLPFRAPVRKEAVYLLTAESRLRLPTPPTMRNKGNYIASLCEIVRWLGEKAEALGVNVFTGFPGASFMYPLAPNLVALGLVVGLDYRDGALDVHSLFQRMKLHPLFRRYLEGGEMVEWGAKTIPEGGYHSIPARRSGDGVVILGDAAGFVDVPSLKGIHYAMQSGMLAARAILGALQAGDVSPARLADYDRMVSESFIVQDLYRTRNMRLAFKDGFYAGGLKAALMTLTGGRFPGRKITMQRDAEVARHIAPGVSPGPVVPDGRLTFSKVDGVFKSGNVTRDTIPGHLIVGWEGTAELAEFYARLCPAGVYEQVDGGLRVNAPNCIDCKATDVLGPRWTPREGGSGPKYKRM